MLPKKEIEEIRRKVEKSGKKMPKIFGVLSDEGRFKIFRVLMAGNEFCVTDIARIFQISVPAASYQLRIMEMSDLVEKKRAGQEICYKINRKNLFVEKISQIIFKGRDY